MSEILITRATEGGKFVLYHYTPSLVAAAIFAALFAGTTLFHIWQLIKQRTWYFIPLVLGGLFEVIGYAARGVSHNDKEKLPPYIAQSVLLLVAPALFAASIYMVLGRIILVLDAEDAALIKKKWLTKIFVTGDVLSFFVQSGGAGIMTGKTANSASLGSKIIVVGLFLQIAFFGFFMIVSAHFNMKIRHTHAHSSIPWKKHLNTLYGVSTLILIRSIFRAVEYIQGNDGYLLRNEVWLYLFDAVLMFGVMVWENINHPNEITRYLRSKTGELGYDNVALRDNIK